MQMQIEQTANNAGYYDIQITNIKINGENNIQEPHRLLILVSSERINSSLTWKGALNRHQDQISADYDNFASLSQNQRIKHFHNSTDNLSISSYLINYQSNEDNIKEDNRASFSIQIKQNVDNFCCPLCVNGECKEDSFTCQCKVTDQHFIFDRQCSLKSIQLYPFIESQVNTNQLMTYRYIELVDLRKGSSLRIKTSNSKNRVSFLIYHEENGNFSVPNLLVDSFILDSTSAKEFYFSSSWLQKAAKKSLSLQNPILRIIIGLYNFAEDNTEFSITFYDTENGIFIGEMPDWAVYFFSTLTIIGLILVAATAFSLIRGQLATPYSSEIQQARTPQPLTSEIIQKYMPEQRYKQIKQETIESDVEEQLECIICLEEYKDDDKVRLTLCNHLFHSDCIDSWLWKHKSCPYCRQELSEKDMQSGSKTNVRKNKVITKKQQQKELQLFREYLRKTEKLESLKGIIHKDSAEQIKESRKLKNEALNASTATYNKEVPEIQQVQTDTDKPPQSERQQKKTPIQNLLNQNKLIEKRNLYKGRSNSVLETPRNSKSFQNDSIKLTQDQKQKTEEDHDFTSGNSFMQPKGSLNKEDDFSKMGSLRPFLRGVTCVDAEQDKHLQSQSTLKELIQFQGSVSELKLRLNISSPFEFLNQETSKKDEINNNNIFSINSYKESDPFTETIKLQHQSKNNKYQNGFVKLEEEGEKEGEEK